VNDHKNSPVFRPEAGHQARDLVKRAFEAAGWNAAVEPRRADRMRPDFLLSHGPYQYVAEVKAIPRGSSVPLEDSWSRACLQAQRYANNNARPLAIVVAPKISPKAFERLAMFADQYAPDVAMGVMDHLGLQMFRGPGLEALNREPQMASSQHDARRLVSKNLFSNLNQWLLKVLLAPEIPERLMGAPRQDCRSASALAAAAECSVMSAHRFVDDLRREG
jgi:hypothetical protein